MNTNRVTVRYAKALIELASENKVLDAVDADLRILYAAMNEYQGFADYITNPGHSSSEKYAQIKKLFSADFHELSMKFLKLVFKNNRELYLEDLCRNAIDMARKLKGIVTSELTFAKTVNLDLSEQIQTKFEEKLNAKLEMSTATEPDLIGGFIFTIDGFQYDASIASRLNKIKSQLQLKS